MLSFENSVAWKDDNGTQCCIQAGWSSAKIAVGTTRQQTVVSTACALTVLDEKVALQETQTAVDQVVAALGDRSAITTQTNSVGRAAGGLPLFEKGGSVPHPGFVAGEKFTYEGVIQLAVTGTDKLSCKNKLAERTQGANATLLNVTTGIKELVQALRHVEAEATRALNSGDARSATCGREHDKNACLVSRAKAQRQ
ncbi:hypothetical protein TRVL_09238 [Trypanosoma vivax]|nr:hypothetical protein TRVL_09238 [Trypanosoma vivax]